MNPQVDESERMGKGTRSDTPASTGQGATSQRKKGTAFRAKAL